MTIELTVTELTVIPGLNAVNLTITPTFSSGGYQSSPIISISKNGVNIAPDVLKNVDIKVPTKTSDLTNDSDFVSDVDYATDKARIKNTSGTNTGDQDLSDLQTKIGATLETASTTIEAAINEVRTIALGSDIAYVFDTETDMNAWLLVPENVAKLQVGNLFLIREVVVPDYWWDGTQALELEVKIDLTNYYTKLEIDQLLGNYEPANANIQSHISATGNPHGTTLAGLLDVVGTDTTIPSGSSFLFKITSGLFKTITDSNFVTWLNTTFFSKTESDRRFVNQNDGTIYHITRWFTPTSALTIAANGLSATITSGQFTAAMTGAKLRLTGGVNEPIITAVDVPNRRITLSFAVDASFFGQSVAVADWGVYSARYSSGVFFSHSQSSTQYSLISTSTSVFYQGVFADSGESVLLNGLGMQLSASDIITWAGVNTPNVQNQTKDTGLFRPSAGLLQIYDGITTSALRDLKLRSLFADKIQPNTTTGLKIGTVYNTSLTTATNNTAVISIAVQDTTGFPATGTILIGGVTIVNYTSKTTTSFNFASTTIPTYVVGTEVLVTSAGDYTTIEPDGTIKFNGAATVWGDIDFPILIRTTGAGIPTLSTFNGNLQMPQWAVNDFNQCESQEFVHEWKEGSTCYFHLHLNTNGLDATNRYVKFEIEYAYSANGVWQFPAVVTTADILIPANTANKTQIIMPLFNFTPSTSKIGDHVIARLKRVASTGLAPTNNPFIPMLQMHIEKDTFGSRNMTTKL